MNCWASIISGCNNKISREHYISDSFFESTEIVVFGFQWCNKGPKRIGLSNAVSKILCEHHNSSLSDYDNEVSKLSSFLTENIRDKPLLDSSIDLDGTYIEKWALKTFLNLGYLGALDPEKHTRIIPRKELVSYLYEKTSLGSGAGLYFMRNSINSDNYLNSFSWNAIQDLSNYGEVVGMTFTINGLRFIITANPVDSIEVLERLGVVDGYDFSKSGVIFRPDNIVFKSDNSGEKVINLKWKA